MCYTKAYNPLFTIHLFMKLVSILIVSTIFHLRTFAAEAIDSYTPLLSLYSEPLPMSCTRPAVILKATDAWQLIAQCTQVGKKKWVCFKCSETIYGNKHALAYHLCTHTKEKPFKCPVAGCYNQFLQPSHLRTHEKIHANTKPYTCDRCNLRFVQKITLERHMRSQQHATRSDDKITAKKRSFNDTLTINEITLIPATALGDRLFTEHDLLNIVGV